MCELILELKNISKAFNHITVLDKVSFTLKKGEVHALMGGNGAGKSTLMKILTGVYEKDSGQIFIKGHEITINSPMDSRKYGISMIFQEFSLIPTLSIAQNVFLTRENKKLGLLDDQKANQETKRLFNELHIEIDPKTQLSNLGVGYWQLTEIIKALSQNIEILIMDEPTSSLSKKETESLFNLIKRLKEKGISIIYISHRMEEIFKVCDRVTVLRDGKNVITEDLNNLSLDSLINYMVGSSVGATFEWKERINKANPANPEPPLLEVRNLSIDKKVKDVSFKVNRGEIVGIAGLMGSGRTETALALFGINKNTEGEIFVKGKKVIIRNPQDAIKAGITLVPENRRTQGLILEHSVKDNLLLPLLKKVRTHFFIDDYKGETIAKEYINKLNIKTDSLETIVKSLSGGNQQKVVLAKWLANSPDILILDEPTIGVDIKAKSEIINIIRRLADEGKGILIISSEIHELLAVSDRIIVFYNGRVHKELSRKHIQSEEVLHRAIQGY